MEFKTGKYSMFGPRGVAAANATWAMARVRLRALLPPSHEYVAAALGAPMDTEMIAEARARGRSPLGTAMAMKRAQGVEEPSPWD